MKSLNDLIHLLLCKMHHECDVLKVFDREEGKCYYYLENDIEGGESMPDHITWISNVEKLKKSLSCKDDDEFLDFIKDCLHISHSIQGLVKGNSIRLNFIKTIINL